MPDPQTILFAGGGTGGHLYPGISVAQALTTLMPDVKPLFLCTQREIDKIILAPTGFEMIPQSIVPPVKTIAGLMKFWKGWRETKDLVKRIIKERSPIAVLGLGGYAAGVAVKLAAQAKIPAAILNPDVIPGKANHYLMRYVKAVCCQFEASRQHVAKEHREKIRVTGCPVRIEMSTPNSASSDSAQSFAAGAQLRAPDRITAAKRLGLDPKSHTLVVTGASQGAKSVNDAVLESLPGLKMQGWQILHLAGRDHAAAVTTAYRTQSIPARVIDFTADMADVWAVADLAISRSGGSTCAELTACGVPSILFPYPFHKDMHQRANAQQLEQAGAAVLMDDQKEGQKNAEKLRPVLERLLYDGEGRSAMAEAAKRIGRPDAGNAVAEVLQGLIGGA